MQVAIASIQRNRNPWIVEWLAFHMAVGFNRFFIYCHECDDGMPQTLETLSRHYPITFYTVQAPEKPQLAAYQHAIDTHNAEVDWMAFIDGDEFLFPVQAPDIQQALAEFNGHEMSALGVYWMCYGSSGHLEEPDGLLMENFTRHSKPDFGPNRHIKSVIKGRQQARAATSHIFATERGTYDERLRQLTTPMLNDPAQQPSHAKLRINHYVTQSYDYFKGVKQKLAAADRTPVVLRGDDWFFAHDRNECDDGLSYNFLVRLKLKVRELEAVLGR